QTVPSSLTALLIAVTPLWFALLDWLRPGGTRPSFQTMLGIVVGFVGVAMLASGPGLLRPNAVDLRGVAALMLASIAWASGSHYLGGSSDRPWRCDHHNQERVGQFHRENSRRGDQKFNQRL